MYDSPNCLILSFNITVNGYEQGILWRIYSQNEILSCMIVEINKVFKLIIKDGNQENAWYTGLKINLQILIVWIRLWTSKCSIACSQNDIRN